MKLAPSTLLGFTEDLIKAICANDNTRHNNMAMVAALSVKEMPQILNQKSMFSATIAYREVLAVLTKVRLGIPSTMENVSEATLVLTYDRFNAVIRETKKMLVSVNS